MNSLKKYTFPLFESICARDGKIQNAEYHEKRFQDSFQKFFAEKPRYALLEGIFIPKIHAKEKVKLRISYGLKGKESSFHPYKQKTVNTLKVVHDNEIHYPLKFEDRSHLDTLFEQRANCDDVLIVKRDLITDSSYANLVFFDGRQWLTPSLPLLRGTMRAKLLNDGQLKESEISLQDLKHFEGFQLINSMLGFDEFLKFPMAGIKI